MSVPRTWRRLDATFFERGAEELGRVLVGKLLVHRTSDGVVAGRIVETEAYLSSRDPASHAYRGKTARNAAMFEAPGTAYVYRIYGMHHCINVVAAPKGSAEAVLLRALVPLAGVELMRARRGREDLRELCSGPGKLVEALAIGPEHDGVSFLRGPLGLWSDGAHPQVALEIDATRRIGITKAAELELRFVLRGSPFLSKRSAPGERRRPRGSRGRR